MLRDTATTSTSEDVFVPSNTVSQTKTEPKRKTVEFRLETDDLKHFGLQAGDVLIVSAGVKWDDVKPGRLYLIDHKLVPRRWAAAVEVVKDHIPDVPKGSSVYLHEGFFKSTAIYSKKVLTLIGEVVAFQRNISIPE